MDFFVRTSFCQIHRFTFNPLQSPASLYILSSGEEVDVDNMVRGGHVLRERVAGKSRCDISTPLTTPPPVIATLFT